jgi:hypothetical protein
MPLIRAKQAGSDDSLSLNEELENICCCLRRVQHPPVQGTQEKSHDSNLASNLTHR